VARSIQLDAEDPTGTPFGQHLQCFRELHTLLFHDERDYVAACTAGAEAVPALPFGRNDE
jgi:hypothetical protein